MISSLIIYSSTDGHTKTICKRIIDFLKDENVVKLVSLNEAKNLNLSEFNRIIIGASIRYGKHSKELYKYVANRTGHFNNRSLRSESSPLHYSAMFGNFEISKLIIENENNKNPQDKLGINIRNRVGTYRRTFSLEIFRN